MNKHNNKLHNPKILIIATTAILFALFSVFGLSLITGNKDQSSIGNSLASATEPADINSDNKVDVFDLSILLSKWNTNDSTSDLNKDNTTNVFDLSILLSKWGAVTTTPPTNTGIYGTGFNMDVLQNLRVGGPYDGSVTNRFRAKQSGSLVAFRTWFKNMGDVKVGYGGGTGGIMSITIETDNNGVPSGNVLGTAIHYPGAADANGINPGRFSLVEFNAPVPVTAGQIYHVVYRNSDPNPEINYSSINGTYVYGPNYPIPAQPKWPDDSLAMLNRFGSGSWDIFPGTSPMLDLTFADGHHEGQGYMEPEVANEGRIEGANYMTRERFTISGGNRKIDKVAVRIAKNSGAGNLFVRLEDSRGNVIDSTSISSANVPIINSEITTGSLPAGIWVYGNFSAARTLLDGQSYSLRLSTDTSTSLWTRGIQQGDWYGFHSDTYFSDGILEISTNGGSTWATVGGLGNSGDLQFYLY